MKPQKPQFHPFAAAFSAPAAAKSAELGVKINFKNFLLTSLFYCYTVTKNIKYHCNRREAQRLSYVTASRQNRSTVTWLLQPVTNCYKLLLQNCYKRKLLTVNGLPAPKTCL